MAPRTTDRSPRCAFCTWWLASTVRAAERTLLRHLRVLVSSASMSSSVRCARHAPRHLQPAVWASSSGARLVANAALSSPVPLGSIVSWSCPPRPRNDFHLARSVLFGRATAAATVSSPSLPPVTRERHRPPSSALGECAVRASCPQQDRVPGGGAPRRVFGARGRSPVGFGLVRLRTPVGAVFDIFSRALDPTEGSVLATGRLSSLPKGTRNSSVRSRGRPPPRLPIEERDSERHNSLDRVWKRTRTPRRERDDQRQQEPREDDTDHDVDQSDDIKLTPQTRPEHASPSRRDGPGRRVFNALSEEGNHHFVPVRGRVQGS